MEESIKEQLEKMSEDIVQNFQQQMQQVGASFEMGGIHVPARAHTHSLTNTHTHTHTHTHTLTNTHTHTLKKGRE